MWFWGTAIDFSQASNITVQKFSSPNTIELRNIFKKQGFDPYITHHSFFILNLNWAIQLHDLAMGWVLMHNRMVWNLLPKTSLWSLKDILYLQLALVWLEIQSCGYIYKSVNNFIKKYPWGAWFVKNGDFFTINLAWSRFFSCKILTQFVENCQKFSRRTPQYDIVLGSP